MNKTPQTLENKLVTNELSLNLPSISLKQNFKVELLSPLQVFFKR